MRILTHAIGTALPLLAALRAMSQSTDGCWSHSPPRFADASRTAAAAGLRSVRAEPVPGSPPVIDGRLTEDAWCRARPASDFVQSTPAPGSLATLPSTARVLFDDAAVYVAVQLSDPHPDSIVAPFPRRDEEVTSDWVFVEIDTRFDRRSGFSFGLNPRGVQVDGTWWNDVTYDPAWNGVWQGAATMTADGWTAEFRIPFSQLALAHVSSGDPLTWGLNIYRHTPHRGETSNWSPRLPSVTGVVSHFNHLEGIVAPPRSIPVELLPYGSVTTVRAPANVADGMKHRLGGDIRVRPTSSSSATVSVVPDFGQVEADPSQVNLTTFETFLQERRPVFVEGADVFQFPSALVFSSRGTSFAEESPFYSRRVGQPSVAGLPAELAGDDAPNATTVLAAGRFSARSASGWSGGLFHAWTDAEHRSFVDTNGVRRSIQIDPLASFTVGRLTRESRDGTAGLGFLLTAVNRVDLSARLDSQLPREAIVMGTDARKRWSDHELTAFLLGSRLAGSGAAIGSVRAETRHGYDRATSLDATPAPNDTSHRSLTGLAAQARVARTSGRLLWGLAGRVVTQGFEANDAGFQRNADWILLTGDWKYQRYRADRLIRRWSLGSSGVGLGWTTHGERRAGIGALSVGGDLRNYWGGTFSAVHELEATDPEVLRGGPAFRLPERDRISASLYSDTRRAWQFTLGLADEREPASGSHRESVSPGLDAFMTDRLQVGIAPSVAWIREGWQYVGQATALTRDARLRARYLLGQLDQREVSLTTRATQAFSSHLTLQWYAQAFVSSGQYDGFAEVRAPRAARPSDRVLTIAPPRLAYDSARATYRLDQGSDSAAVFRDPAFTNRSLHINAVLRWEFLPGSALFLVWTQERGDPTPAPFRLGDDVRRLTRSAPTNALQVKVSYWFAP